MRAWRKWRNPTVKPPFGSRIDWSDPITEGLVGCWLFNEFTGVIYNLVDSNGSTFYGNTSWDGDSCYFDGDNDYIITETRAPIQPPLSVVSIIDCVENGASSAIIGATMNDASGWALKYEQSSNTGKIGFTKFGIIDITSSITSPVGKSFVSVVVSSVDVMFFVNGQVDIVSNSASMNTPPDDRIVFGVYYRDGTLYDDLKGKIFTAYLFSRILPLADVERLYHEPYSMFLAPFPIVIVDLGAGQSYAYEGNIPLGLIPSAVKEVRYYREGQAPIVITPQAQAQATYRREGQQSIALTPGAEARATYRKEGNVLLRFAVAAEKAARYFAVGQVPLAVQVAGEKQVLYRRSGSTPLSLIPDAQVRASYTHEGDIPVALSVQADIACRFNVEGGVGLVILPQGTWVYQPATGGTVYTYVGNIPLAFVPEAEAKALFSETGEIFLNITPAAEVQAVYRPISELLLKLRPEGEATAAFSIEGEIQLRLTPQGVAVLIKPSESEELFVIGVIEEDDIRAVFDGALHATIWPRQ